MEVLTSGGEAGSIDEARTVDDRSVDAASRGIFRSRVVLPEICGVPLGDEEGETADSAKDLRGWISSAPSPVSQTRHIGLKRAVDVTGYSRTSSTTDAWVLVIGRPSRQSLGVALNISQNGGER